MLTIETDSKIQPMSKREPEKVELQVVAIAGETFYKIANMHRMRPFMMNVVSDANHWMFIMSNGGLTAGRKNAEYALFPYYTDDKLAEFAEITGSKSIFQISTPERVHIWEPFSARFTGKYTISRHLYKNISGNKVIFEEQNHDLGLCFRYQWCSSNLFGFLRKAALINSSTQDYQITLLDGIQNIMPHGVSSFLQNSTSNLVDAYKRNELHRESGLGIYALSAHIVDKAEPSESLKANVAWSLGIRAKNYLLSSLQLDKFRCGEEVTGEKDVKGEKGAYFLLADLTLPKGAEKSWKIIANVNADHAHVARLINLIRKNEELDAQIEQDIWRGTENLQQSIAEADGLQYTSDQLKDARHFSNVLFNIMRGGIFDEHYQIEKRDFTEYFQKANHEITTRHQAFFQSLKPLFSKQELERLLAQNTDPDFIRLAKEYLPLRFSRRHGDPSRPWNKFTINTHSEIDGSKILDYEGNWRDIFQNWEALAHSYPEFIEGMIFKFLNASTFDGYNPYRLTKDGFDWEVIEPENPWSYIGYWGDHQIIYLLKFLEFAQQKNADALRSLFDKDFFVYAHVPYRIKPYNELVKDSKNTILFDEEADHRIRERIAEIGSDGSLLGSQRESLYRVNFIEKILATALSKTSNFIPEGGIWMNTQRPEWNDANNALVGNGVSMVTLYYLRRFFRFLEAMLEKQQNGQVEISAELAELFKAIAKALNEHRSVLNGPISGVDRRRLVDALGQAGSDFREKIYQYGFKGDKTALSLNEIKAFVQVALQHFEHSIRANRREDHLYHAYNLLTFREKEIELHHLNEMLEGQVAAISSGMLSAAETVAVMDALRKSALYREDQNSYVLYPNKELPGFLQKNIIPAPAVDGSELLKKLLAEDNQQIIVRDENGQYHFNGNFHNATDVEAALAQLDSETYAEFVVREKSYVLQVFESVFHHKAFTGRSGTFFAYEGLGSIYWHMVSKLYLAVQEACVQAQKEQTSPEIRERLLAHFYEIGEGIGIHKSPDVYGAFPTDAYSHTPMHRGAQQPGMTGQVKEDILVRIAELGVFIENGQLRFAPFLLRQTEFLTASKTARFIDLAGNTIELQVPEKSLAFSYCQVPVVYQLGNEPKIEAKMNDGQSLNIDGLLLSAELSSHLFNRSGKVNHLIVTLTEKEIKA